MLCQAMKGKRGTERAEAARRGRQVLTGDVVKCEKKTKKYKIQWSQTTGFLFLGCGQDSTASRKIWPVFA